MPARRLLAVSRGGGGFTAPTFAVSGPYSPATGLAAFLTQVHCHTTQSDGSYTPAEVVDFYISRGYQALAITDHDLATSQPVGIDTAITGNEHSPSQQHIIALNSDYTRGVTTDAQTIIDAIVADGGEAQIAHPLWSVGMSFAEMDALTDYIGMEIHNQKVVSGAGQNPVTFPGFAVSRWDALLQGARKDVWAFAVDDLHYLDAYDTYDVGRLQVFAEQNTVADIMAALAAGNFVADVSNYGVTPGYPIRGNLGVSLSCPGAVLMEAWGSSGLLAATTGSSIAYGFEGTEDYVRLAAVGDYTEPFGAALGNEWSAVSGTWTVGSGVLSLSSDSTVRVLVLRRHREGDFQAQVDVKLNHASGAMLLLFNNLHADWYYGVRIGVGSGAENNALAIRKVNNAVSSNPATTAYTADPAEWQTVKLDYTAATGRIRAKVWERDNESEPGSWMIDTNDTTWTHGGFGLRATHTPDFDNFYASGFKTYYQPIAID